MWKSVIGAAVVAAAVTISAPSRAGTEWKKCRAWAGCDHGAHTGLRALRIYLCVHPALSGDIQLWISLRI